MTTELEKQLRDRIDKLQNEGRRQRRQIRELSEELLDLRHHATNDGYELDALKYRGAVELICSVCYHDIPKEPLLCRACARAGIVSVRISACRCSVPVDDCKRCAERAEWVANGLSGW